MDEENYRGQTPTEPARDSGPESPKRKSSAEVYVADGAGGMRPIVDQRFEEGDWPINLVVRAEDAQTWMAHLEAEIEDRGWSSSAFSQLHGAENSGTISVHAAGGASPPTLDVVWEKVRDAQLLIRARPSEKPPLSIDVARALVDAVSDRQRSRKTLRAHRREFLAYEGLPWRGELWLDGDHRLGPPSKHPDTLLGPQVLILDAIVEGIGQKGVTANFQERINELRIFLGFVLGMNAKPSRSDFAWVPEIDPNGHIKDSTLKAVGYFETAATTSFPQPGTVPPVERRDVTRPGLGPLRITFDMHEQWVPADIEQLWAAFAGLPASKRDHLMRAGNAYLTAKAMWPDQRTAYATFLVVACEALKPIGKRYNKMNVYEVVGLILGSDESDRLRRMSSRPQGIRDRLLHRGELAAGELGPMLIHDYFRDPSFDDMLRELSVITRVCLIEWLRREMKSISVHSASR